jgi:hypothetical protein
MALAKSQQSLKKWTKQKWKTSDGKPSKGKKRYLPKAAWANLTPAEKAATNSKGKARKKASSLLNNPSQSQRKRQGIDNGDRHSR